MKAAGYHTLASEANQDIVSELITFEKAPGVSKVVQFQGWRCRPCAVTSYNIVINTLARAGAVECALSSATTL